MLNSVTKGTIAVVETAPARIPASEKSLTVPFLIIMLVRPGSTTIPSTSRTFFDFCERVLPLRSSVTLEALILIAAGCLYLG